MASEVELDSRGTVAVINTTGVTASRVQAALADQGAKEMADAIGQWVTRTNSSNGFDGTGRRRRLGGIFDRDRWLMPRTTYERIRLAREALHDDVIGNAADGSEALAFGGVSMFTEDEDEQDAWNQIAADIDLDSQWRKAWRIGFSDSQFVYAVWWGTRSYTPRNKTEQGQQRRTEKFHNLTVPVGMTFLDTTKIAPVGNLMFGQERLAYLATPLEAMRFDEVLAARDGTVAPVRPPWVSMPSRFGSGRRVLVSTSRALQPGRLTAAVDAEMQDVLLDDPLVRTIVVGRYQPPWEEAQQLEEDGVDISNLFLLNPSYVFRHCLTRPDWDRFAEVRLDKAFELLDLKAQLRQMDRAHLIGGTNFIVVITKGTDAHPAVQAEINALQSTAYTLANVPVIVGDHRLEVKIITPKLDVTLDRKRHDTIDVRLFALAWQTFVQTGTDVDDPLKLGKVIGRGLESRRKMMRRNFELNIVHRTRLLNTKAFTGRAKMVFSPQTISLEFDQHRVAMLADLRAQNELSRQTELAQFDIDQSDEAILLKRERDHFDETFQTINPNNQGQPGQPGGPVDQTTPPPADPKAKGQARAAQRAAGRAATGGGAAKPNAGQGQAPKNPRRTADPSPAIGAAEETLASLGEQVAAYELSEQHATDERDRLVARRDAGEQIAASDIDTVEGDILRYAHLRSELSGLEAAAEQRVEHLKALHSLDRNELAARARELQIPRRSRLNADELLAAIIEAEET